MPAHEQTTKDRERCALHPRKASVVQCAGCGRRLCLSCATPVRGRTLGPECLETTLGEARPADPPAGRSAAPWSVRATVISFALATLASALPWSRFGEGSGPLGGWGLSPRWSVLAASAAVAGLLVSWALSRRPPSRESRRPLVPLGLLAAAVTGGSVLAVVHPPAFVQISVGPWVAMAAGIGAAAGTAACARRPAGPPPGQRV